MKRKRLLPLRVSANIYEDDVEGLKKYLQKTKKPVDMAWLLFSASAGDSPRILYWLLAKHDPNITHEFAGDGTTPLMWAALNNEPLTIHLLLNAGAEINAIDNYGSSALCNAAYHGANDVIALLLQYGADINLGNPLAGAAMNGHIETLQLLLGAGAEVNVLSNNETSALELAAFYGQLKAVKLLVKAGANIAQLNEEGKTAENLATEQGHDKIAKYLRRKSQP